MYSDDDFYKEIDKIEMHVAEEYGVSFVEDYKMTYEERNKNG